jgi:hypothetical protein
MPTISLRNSSSITSSGANPTLVPSFGSGDDFVGVFGRKEGPWTGVGIGDEVVDGIFEFPGEGRILGQFESAHAMRLQSDAPARCAARR